ncbi:damage-inducible protein DinB [Flavobacterium cyanobacteriorum]|uniref:Damage-inducible protein DinB n=1 Tax=Flavobacterium cyanobacteriorum TaxID=2022802 RepID=A0A255Z798_9FLAO|nr:DinB family protein [Flavobacterium cyanobacteriorum]OYQ36784.1 damage-inducible protein DinB [Flavobacterium cyanobacteriorum]
MNIKELPATEYADFYAPYIATVDDTWNLVEELEVSVHNFIHFVREIPLDKFDYRYAEGKWTIKDIIQHLIDAERVFAYRALRIARNDSTPLPGFDENSYVDSAGAGWRSIQDLLTEMALVRQSTITLFKSFRDGDLLKSGVASGRTVSVRALGFIIIGHQNHHMRVFSERYL